MHSKFAQLPNFVPNNQILYKQGGFGYGQYTDTANQIYSGSAVYSTDTNGIVRSAKNISNELININNKKNIERYNNFAYIAAVIKKHDLSCVL